MEEQRFVKSGGWGKKAGIIKGIMRS